MNKPTITALNLPSLLGGIGPSHQIVGPIKSVRPQTQSLQDSFLTSNNQRFLSEVQSGYSSKKQSIRVRKTENADITGIFRLHEQAFKPVSGQQYTQTQHVLQKQMDEEKIYVATLADSIVGFISFETISNQLKEKFEKHLQFSRESDPIAILKKSDYLKTVRDRINTGDVSVVTYKNALTESTSSLSENDIVCNSIVVDPKYRRSGIAKILGATILAKAKEQQAQHILVSCWEGGQSSKLCQDVGFDPILRLSPAFPDGNGVLYMGFKI